MAGPAAAANVFGPNRAEPQAEPDIEAPAGDRPADTPALAQGIQHSSVEYQAGPRAPASPRVSIRLLIHHAGNPDHVERITASVRNLLTNNVSTNVMGRKGLKRELLWNITNWERAEAKQLKDLLAPIAGMHMPRAGSLP